MEKSLRAHWGRCRLLSEFVYAICKILHLKGVYKINIIHDMSGNKIGQRGHAWVTCNEKDLFITPSYRSRTMTKIGENDKYCYWASYQKGHLKYRKDK